MATGAVLEAETLARAQLARLVAADFDGYIEHEAAHAAACAAVGGSADLPPGALDTLIDLQARIAAWLEAAAADVRFAMSRLQRSRTAMSAYLQSAAGRGHDLLAG